MRELRSIRSVRTRIRLVAVFTAAIVLAGCARSPITTTDDWTRHLPDGGAPSALPAPVGLPSSSASASPAPIPTVSTTPKPKPTKVDPFAQLSAKTRKEFRPCVKKVVGPGSSGRCASLLLKKLKKAGFYRWGGSGYVNTAGVNALLNYQRSRGIYGSGTTGRATWLALATRARAVPNVLPRKCTTTKGIVLCVDQAHRKLFWIRNHKVVKTFRVRLGGWNFHPKTKKWKVFATANGTWHVYDKQVNPKSKNYGSGAMPYSTMFYPDMYVHYSPVFHRVGYATSSHGCVNIASLSDAVWIFQHTPIGATVHIYSLKASH